MSLPFSIQEEVLYVIYHINSVTSFFGTSLLAALKDFYKQSRDGVPPDARHMGSVLLLLKAKQFFKQFYALSTIRCKSYQPDDPKQTPLSNKLSIDQIDTEKHLCIDILQTSWWNDGNQCYELFKLVLFLLYD